MYKPLKQRLIINKFYSHLSLIKLFNSRHYPRLKIHSETHLHFKVWDLKCKVEVWFCYIRTWLYSHMRLFIIHASKYLIFRTACRSLMYKSLICKLLRMMRSQYIFMTKPELSITECCAYGQLICGLLLSFRHVCSTQNHTGD